VCQVLSNLPSPSTSSFTEECQENTAEVSRAEDGCVRGKLWSRSYFVATVGNVTADIVKKYVEEQWEKEK